MFGKRIRHAIADNKKTAITLIVGLIAGPIVGAILIDYVSITPKRLAGLLEHDEVSVTEQVLNITESSKSKTQVSEFNELRKQFKQQVRLENLDLSNRTLSGANLDSLIITDSNLSNTNLENSI
jgi:uncharacterized protein YjbI with pentapeptide repeats